MCDLHKTIFFRDGVNGRKTRRTLVNSEFFNYLIMLSVLTQNQYIYIIILIRQTQKDVFMSFLSSNCFMNT